MNWKRSIKNTHTKTRGFGRPLSISGKEVNLNVDTDGQGE